MPAQLEVAILASDAGRAAPVAGKQEPVPKGVGDGKAIAGRIKLDSEHEDGTCRFRLAGRQARNP
jgi:hypothetical protein